MYLYSVFEKYTVLVVLEVFLPFAFFFFLHLSLQFYFCETEAFLSSQLQEKSHIFQFNS